MKLILEERQGQNNEQSLSLKNVLLCKESGLDIGKSFFCWVLLLFISRHLFPCVQLLQKLQFVRVSDDTNAHASINILIRRFQ